MTISIWRYSHLALAVSSFLFVALAAVTGTILAFDPVAQKAQHYRAENFDTLTLAAVLPVIKQNYTGITEINVDANQFVIVHGINANDKPVVAYVNPVTGIELGIQKKQSDFFNG